MICAVVLAAGASRRMGSQKLLLPWAGKTVIEHIVDQLLLSRIDQVVIVTGHDHERLTQTLRDYPVELVYNSGYTAGMLSSVRCGIRVLPAACTGVLVALGDQPWLRTQTVDVLIDHFLAHPKIVLPVHQNRRGHPLLFARQYSERVLHHYDDVGLRGLLNEYARDVQEVPIDAEGVLLDLDVPEDYRKSQ